MMIDKRDNIIHMSQEENDILWDTILNDTHNLLVEPKTKTYGFSVRYNNEDILVPIFETFTEARNHGIGQNNVIERTCTLDNGTKQIFYIPKPTEERISSLN